MSRKKILLMTLITTVSLLLLVSAYFYFIRPRPSKGSAELIGVIPDDAVFILLVNQPVSLLAELQAAAYWNDLKSIPLVDSINRILLRIDSSMKINPRFAGFVQEYPSAISFHHDSTGHTGFLFLHELPSVFHHRTFRHFIVGGKPGENKPQSYSHRGRTIYRDTSDNIGHGILYSFTRGYFLIGSDSAILYKALDHLDEGKKTFLRDPSLSRAYKTTGKMVNAYLLINNRLLSRVATQLLDRDRGELFTGFSFPTGWTALDLFIKEKELILSGFTALEDTTDAFYQVHQKSMPQPSTIQQILPFHTAFSVQLTLYPFYESMEKMDREVMDSLDTIRIFSREDPSQKIDFKKRISSIPGSEIGLAFTGPWGASVPDHAYLILHSGNMENSRVSLDLLSEPQPGTENQTGGFQIRKLCMENPYKIIFHPLARDNPFQWYVIIDEFIIFGKSSSAVQKFASYHRSGRNFGSLPLYSAYMDNFSEKSNITVHMNIRNAGDPILEILNDSVAKFIRKNKKILDGFDGLAIQYSATGDLLYTNIHLNYDPDFAPESPYVWRTALDTSVQKGPFFIFNPVTKKGNILIVDHLNQMILLDESGAVQWKFMVSGPVLSDVFQVDYNRKSIENLLFNTADYVYMIDMNGNPTGPYPVTLPSKATSGLIVLDYEKKKDYRILLACEDHRIHNLDIQGNPVKGWTLPETESIVPYRAQHLTVSGKDFLIFTQMDGDVLMTDRRGDTRLKIEKSFINSARTEFFTGSYPDNRSLITTDIYGNVIFISASGKINKESFGDFLPDHYFVLADFTNDGKHDFIFLDREQLSVFNQAKDSVFSFQFEDPVDHSPLVFTIPSLATHLGFYSTASGTIYLLTTDGPAEWTEGIRSDRPFQIGTLDAESTLYLISAYKNQVFCYLFE